LKFSRTRRLELPGGDDRATVVVRKVCWNQSRSSGQKEWAGRKIRCFGAGRERNTKSSACLKSMEFFHLEPQPEQPNKGQSRREDEGDSRQRALSALKIVLATEHYQIK